MAPIDANRRDQYHRLKRERINLLLINGALAAITAGPNVDAGISQNWRQLSRLLEPLEQPLEPR